MANPYDVAIRHYDALYEEEANLKYVPAHKVDTIRLNFAQSANATSMGLHRLHVLENIMENGFSTRRYYFDKRITNAIIRAMLPVIVGDDWATVGPTIMDDRGILDIYKLVAAMGPRRFGKSMAIGKTMAGIGYVMLLLGGIGIGKTYTQSVFSTNLRTSNGIRSYLLQSYAELGLDVYIIKDTDKQCILCTDPSDRLAPRLVVNFLPSGSTTCVFFAILFYSFIVLVFLVFLGTF